MISPWRVSPSHDEVFLERYGRLLGLSLKLTGHDRQLAEDLLHDAFVQFTLVRPDLESIRNIDGYLYGMLRNMHLSHLRASKSEGGGLRLVDYETIDLSLGTVTPMNHLTARDELRAVCRFACLRKDSSKSASVLILRFFHGYYPAEIALVIASPRKAVDDWIRIARREAKVWINDPLQVSPIGRSQQQRAELEFGACLTTAEFVSDLRSAIFSTGDGPCLNDDDLRRMYDETGDSAPGCRALSHIVSCSRCLDRVNELLGLAPLSDRFPNDMLGPDPGDKSGGSGTGPPSDSTVRKLRSRAKAVFEHTPNELRIAVNGLTVGTQTIESAICEQRFDLCLEEPITFIEVFSEQGVRLLFAPVEQPGDGVELQPVRIDLSDRRRLEVELSFRDQIPRLRTSYADPLYERSSPLSLSSPVATLSTEWNEVREADVDLPRSEPSRFDNWIARLRERSRSMLGIFGKILRPGMVTAMLALVLVIALLLFRSPTPPVLAAELLNRAIASENAAGNLEQVVHRTVYMEERVAASGELIRRNKIELWANAGGVTARRVFDEKDRLVAGEMTRADGSSVLYRPNRIPERTDGRDGRLENLLADGGFWRIDPSAKIFSALADMAVAEVEVRDGVFVLSYEGSEVDAGPVAHLVKIVLTLTKSNLHAIEQTLVVAGPEGTREYHFVEYEFEQLPRSSVAPSRFELDGEFLRGVAHGAPVPDRLESPPPPADGMERLSPLRLAAIEMDAYYRLHQAGVCTREPSSVSRTAEGGLLVEAIVETEKRKSEVVNLMSTVAAIPAVAVKIYTVEEAARQRVELARPPVISGKIEIPGRRIGLYEDLAEYFSAQLPAGDTDSNRVDEMIRRFASRVLGNSRRALINAQAIRRHVTEFSRTELRSSGSEERAKQRAIIHDHLTAFQAETNKLRLELEPVLFSNADTVSAPDVDRGTDLGRIVERLATIAADHDKAVRMALTLSSVGQSQHIKTTEFLRSLKYAESLAAAIDKNY